MIELLYATILEPNMLKGLVDVPPDRVQLVEKNGAMQPLKQAAEAPIALAAAPAPVPPEVPPAAFASQVDTQAKSTPAAAPLQVETTVRLNVALLDSLMTLAGELVLSRNQLVESLSRHDEHGTQTGAQRVSLVTSELQEVVTQTRMQPVGSVFGKLPRLVRHLARDLGQDAHLELDGVE